MKKICAVILSACLFLSACASAEPVGPSPTSAQPEQTADATPTETPDATGYVLSEPIVRVDWERTLGPVVQLIIPVTNTGDRDLYLPGGTVDLEDASGALIKSVDIPAGYPQVIQPGETGWYYEEVHPELETDTELVPILHLEVLPAKVPCIRYPVTDLTVTDSSKYNRINMAGRVENNTSEEQTLIYVAGLLYGADDEPLGLIYTSVDKIQPGDKVGFDRLGIGLPETLKAADVVRVDAFAYDYQFQF